MCDAFTMIWVTSLPSNDTPDKVVMALSVETAPLSVARTSQEGVEQILKCIFKVVSSWLERPLQGWPPCVSSLGCRSDVNHRRCCLTLLGAGGLVKAPASRAAAFAGRGGVCSGLPPRLGGSLLPPSLPIPFSLRHVSSLVGHVGSGLHGDLILTRGPL